MPQRMENAIEFLKEISKKKVKEKGEDFAGHYAKYGLWSNPFCSHDQPLETNFDLLYVANKKQVEELIDMIINGITGKGEDVAIISPIGSGGRSIVNFLKYFLRGLDSEDSDLQLKVLKEKLERIIDVDVCDLAPEVRNQIRKDVTEGLKKSKMMILTSYFCDKHLPLLSLNNKFKESTLDTYRKVLELDSLSADKVIFISPWPATAWQYCAQESPMLKDVYEKTILLKPYTKEQVVEMLLRRVIFFRLKEQTSPLNNKEILGLISEYAGNIPRFAFEFAFLVLEELCKKNEKVNKEKVLKILNEYGPSHEEIKTRLHELIPPPKKWHKKENTIKTILKLMIQLGGEHIIATEISQHMDKSRPAITRNLNKIISFPNKNSKNLWKSRGKDEDETIIRKSENTKKDERRVPYSLPDFVRSIFESEFIIPEIKNKLEHK